VLGLPLPNCAWGGGELFENKEDSVADRTADLLQIKYSRILDQFIIYCELSI
jgi:hypothetical protein